MMVATPTDKLSKTRRIPSSVPLMSDGYPQPGASNRSARRTWRALEAFHGMIYFSPEAAASYEAAGLAGRSGYFASRAAAMGPVPAEVVIATFYNFSPALVRSCIPAAWDAASPGKVLAARHSAADATLRRVLGDAVESSQMERAALLARQAAEAVAHDVAGRPLYAAHAALPWPDQPHMVLWHAQTLLREYRGDGHVAALLTAGLTGIEALVTHAASGAIAAEALRTTRAWPHEAWAEAVEGLRGRGWVSRDGDLALTEAGRQARQEIEDHTDELGARPYQALGEDGCRELQALAAPWTAQIVAQLMPWFRGPEA